MGESIHSLVKGLPHSFAVPVEDPRAAGGKKCTAESIAVVRFGAACFATFDLLLLGDFGINR